MIVYTHFQKWKKENEITNKILQDAARRFSNSNITNITIGRNLSNGYSFDGVVMLAWKKAFGWTQDEMNFLLLNGEINNNKPLREYETDELLIEIGRRMRA